MGAAKIAVPIVSLLLVVGVVIGVIVVIKSNGGEAEEAKNLKTPSMKMVNSICGPTDFKEACTATLESVAKNASSTPSDYIRAVVEAALKEVNNALLATNKVNVDKSKDEYDHVAVEDCKHLLDYAVDMLQGSIAAVKAADLAGLREQQHELLSWMTAVYAFQTTCTDQIKSPEYKSAVESGMLNATQLTHNAVNIVAELTEMLKLFDVKLPTSKQATLSQRRLLALDDGFPYWFGAGDRRLLAKQAAGQLVPDVVVAKDGSGKFKTIKDAINSYPPKFNGRFVIYVKAGVYDEQVIVDKKKPNIFIYGDGIAKTIVTGRRNYAKMNIGTMHTATFANEAPGFIARGMTFRNEAGPEGHQAVAFRSQGDKTAMFDCSFEASQDTLYYQNLKQFYRNCRIYGTVDFIFGKGDCVIQDSQIIVRKPLPNQFNTVTADGREIQRGSNGLVLHHCSIVPDDYLWPVRFEIPTFLGRPWKPEALTVVMQSTLGDFIRPEGWKIWDGSTNHKTCLMYEYGNSGPGAKTNGRNKDFSGFKVISAAEAAKFAPGQFLHANEWLPQTGVPVQMGLY
ncbi:pectinesterase-like [Salvia hispanica]|uniref:pectinesterase-like n=1 Tax=Salvia hispanica TaxID=49212 RepID=UPI00200923BC|nr:pectinesterase-like [Salvia hispanica]